MLNKVNQWALQRVGRDWLDYLASNTMTQFNRRLNPFIWTYDLKAVVVAVKDEATGVKTITLMPNQHWRTMTAGQHIELTIDIDGVPVSRYYSLSPLVDGQFTITVKRVESGELSPWLYQHLQVGMEVKLNHPQGNFCYQQQEKLLFICAGSGITPCYSMISALQQTATCPDIQLYAQFSRSEDIIFAEQLHNWQQVMRVDVALTRPEQRSSDYQTPISDANFTTLFPDFQQRDIYLCGPQGFMDKVITLLKNNGYDLSRLHGERFVAQDYRAAAATDFDISEAEIYFQHLNIRLQLTPADAGKSLMQVAESHGVNIESGCRQGMCGTCKLTLKEGLVTGNSLGSAVYLCTAFPASAKLVLDA